MSRENIGVFTHTLTHIHTDGKRSWIQDTWGSFGVGLDYTDKAPQSSAATVIDSLKRIN